LARDHREARQGDARYPIRFGLFDGPCLSCCHAGAGGRVGL